MQVHVSLLAGYLLGPNSSLKSKLNRFAREFDLTQAFSPHAEEFGGQMRCMVAFAASLLPCVALAGNTGVIPDGPDSYLIMRTGKTGFVSSSSLQKKAYEEAAEYCTEKAKVMETISMDSKAARPFGGFPEATLRFRCVSVGSPEPRTSGAGSSTDEKLAQLERLKRLLDSGALTQDEFNQEKAKLLGQ